MTIVYDIVSGEKLNVVNGNKEMVTSAILNDNILDVNNEDCKIAKLKIDDSVNKLKKDIEHMNYKPKDDF